MSESLTSDRRVLRSVSIAAKHAGVSPRTIRRRIADGSLTGFSLGPRIVRVDLNELDALLAPIPAATATVSRSDDHAASKIAAYVQRVVAEAPPLTPAQRDRIAVLLRGGAAA